MDRKNLRKWLKRASSKTLTSGFFYLAVGVILSGCVGQSVKDSQTAGQNRIPDWVLNPPSDSRYIYGVGSADKFEDLVQSTTIARRQANADIASQLRVTVSQSNVQSTEVTSGSNQSEQVLTSLASRTRVDTEALALEQSETVESTATGKYVYVLQRLDRARIIARLHQEIDEIDGQLETVAAAVNVNADVITQWRSMLPALPLMANRAQSLKLLKLYSQNTVSKGKSSSVLAFEKQLNDLLAALAIHVESQAVRANSMVQNVRSGLTKKGLTPSDSAITNGSKTPLKLMLHVSATEEVQGGRTYVFLTVNAALQQMINGSSMLANWSITERGVSAIPTQAKQAAEIKSAESLADALFQYLTKEE